MASKRVTDLPAIAAPAESDVIMAVQGGANGQVEVDDLVRSAGGVEFTAGGVVLNIAIASTWYDLTGWTTVKTRGSVSGSLVVPPGIVIGAAGAHLLHWSFSGIHAGGANQFLDFRILDDTGAQLIRYKTISAGAGIVSCSGVAWLDATTLASRVRLQVAQIAGIGNLTQYDGHLYATRQ